MKIQEYSYDDYLNNINNYDLHSGLMDNITKKMKLLDDIPNILLYGPPGGGKYSQCLKMLSKYSPSKLKYEKKMSINFNKDEYMYKMSDIHFEIDMSLLGCNSKQLWHQIYTNIFDIVCSRLINNRTAVIVCKNYHDIHNELNDVFYTYIQNVLSRPVNIKIIIITEQKSFIPNNILMSCLHIDIPRPTKTAYNKLIKNNNNSSSLYYNSVAHKLNTKMNVYDIKNINNIILNQEQIYPEKYICENIIIKMKNINNINYIELRESIYELFISNLNIYEYVWYIISKIISDDLLNDNNKISLILLETIRFFRFFNNNYRPIYHIEKFLLKIIYIYHDIKEV
jgi:hypothetical protein